MTSRKPRGRAAREEVRQFKNRLRFALELSGLGQNEVARAVRASQSVASKWFDHAHDTLPGGRFIGRLAHTLGVDGHWLVTGEGHHAHVPVSGHRDTIFMQGSERGARAVIAGVRRALVAAEQDLDYQRQEFTRLAAAAVEDAASDPGDARGGQARRLAGMR